MSRADIGRLDRNYLFDVLMWPREEDGTPVFGEARGGSRLDWLHDLAVKRGLPHPEALAWAARQMTQKKE